MFFQVPLEELSALKQGLKLVKSAVRPNRRDGCAHFAEAREVIFFSSEQPPGPIFPENSQSSFKGLYLDESSGAGCIDLVYPYG